MLDVLFHLLVSMSIMGLVLGFFSPATVPIIEWIVLLLFVFDEVQYTFKMKYIGALSKTIHDLIKRN